MDDGVHDGEEIFIKSHGASDAAIVIDVIQHGRHDGCGPKRRKEKELHVLATRLPLMSNNQAGTFDFDGTAHLQYLVQITLNTCERQEGDLRHGDQT